MNILGRKEIMALIEKEAEHCISIYLPVHRFGDPQDTIRFKNLLGRAQRQLEEKGLRSVEAVKLLEPEHALLEDLQYWKKLGSEGMAVFICAGLRERYLLPARFSESVTVSRRFKVKPLVPLITGDGRFFILALNKNDTRLFIGSRNSITEIGLPEGAPASIQEALKYDESEKQLQYHTGAPAAGGRRQAMFHGQGAGGDDERENITRFFQQLERHLSPVFYEHKIPVVPVGVEYLPPLYREIDSSGTLIPGSLNVNPGALDPDELHRRTWEMVAPLFAEKERKAREKFHALHGTGLAVTDLAEIVTAARDGRVETLFTLEGVQIWGVFDYDRNMIIPVADDFPGAVDLLDLSVALTLSGNGGVYVKKLGDMPVAGDIAAVLRYS
ncbi:MAG TPA: hypothetical protein ENN06_01855 [Desulfobacteraceae bacterium]|nr:hypothetical protein [Desulfobacteraceae bacterium]